MAQTANVGAATRRMIADDLIPARQGGAWLVNRGQHIRVIDGRSKPGDYVDMVAVMDTLCATSACPSTGRPLRVQVYET